jgi:hypothetical protein
MAGTWHFPGQRDEGSSQRGGTVAGFVRFVQFRPKVHLLTAVESK